MSGASPLAYPPATFPLFKSDVQTYVGNTNNSADYLQTTNTTGNATTGSNTIKQLTATTPNNNPYKLIARGYTGISNQIVLDVSGLISGDTHKVIFTDKSAAGVPYTQKNKIDVISFTPTFNSATPTVSNSVDHPDVSMINQKRGDGFITTANGGMQFDCARITLKDRVNVYDGADMQVVIQNNNLTDATYTEERIVKFTSNAGTAPPLRVNGGPGGPSSVSVTIDSSANTGFNGGTPSPTTGVVSLDMGGKVTGLGVDISQIVVAFTDTTDLDLTSVTLDYTRDGRSPTLYTRYKATAAGFTALGNVLTDDKLRTAGALAGTYTAVPLLGALSGKTSATTDITVTDTVTTAAKTIAQAASAGTPEAGKASPATAKATTDIAALASLTTNATAADGTTAITATVAYTAASDSFTVTLSGIAAKLTPTGGAMADITDGNKTLIITAPAGDGAGGNVDAVAALGNLTIILDNSILTKAAALASGVVGSGYKLDEAIGIEAGKLGSGSLAITSLITASTANFAVDGVAYVADSVFRNRKKLADDAIASGKLTNVFEIASANDKTYEFTVAYKDAKGIIGVAKGANTAGLMSDGASPITISSTITRDLAGEMPDTATAKKMNGGKGGVAEITWTAPTYVPGELLNYKIWWLSEKDASNSLAGSGGTNEEYNFLYDDAVAKGNMITIDPSLSAIVPVGENYSGTALTGSENNAALVNNELTDGSGNWAFWVSATVKKLDGTIVDGQIANKSIALYSSNPDQASDANPRRSGKPFNYVSGAPSAPELYKVAGGKDVEALGTGESQLPNYKMENRLHVNYYDDKAESNGLQINGAKFAIFRTKDVPYLPAVIADASFNSALNITGQTIDEGFDLKSIEASNAGDGQGNDQKFVLDYYDDISGVWRNVDHTGGDKNSPSRHNVYTSATDPGVNKYAATNDNIQNLKDGESYSVFMKLSNANGGGVISVGKSALVSSKPNARAFLPGDLAGVPIMSNGRATNADVLGPYWLGSDNIDSTNPSKRNDGATTTVFPGASGAENPEGYLNAIHFNNDAMNAGTGNTNTDARTLDDPVYAGIDSSVGEGSTQEITLPVASTEGVKDTSYCTIDDKSLTLKYSLTYDISRSTFGESAGIPVQAHRARNAASLNVATGGKPITYLKYQVHTPNSSTANNAGAGKDKALARAKEFDEYVAHRTGFGNNAALPWHSMYHEALQANAAGVFYGARKIRDISGGTYPSAPNVTGTLNAITKAMAVQTSYIAAGVQHTEQPQKTIQIAAPKDGKVSIKHYYDASGNPQPLANGVLYNIKLWAGNENGDSIFKDISYANFAPRGQIAAPNTPILQANTTATISNAGKLVLPVRWLDISGDQGAGQFYQSYKLTATQTIGGTERSLATKVFTNAADASPVLGDNAGTATTCANVGKLNSDSVDGGNSDVTPVYGVPIKLTITGFKTVAATGDVTSNVTDRGPNGTKVKGAFGIDGATASAGVDKDLSGATTTTFFNLPIGQSNGENEVQFMETKSADKKLTINWAGSNEANLYTTNTNTEAPVQIVGYSVFLYDASLNSSSSTYTTKTAVNTAFNAAGAAGLQASAFTNTRKATLIASKNVAHTGGEQTIEFDGLENGKAYVPRITTTYAYGPLSSRKVTTTEGGYLGKLATATSAAPTAVNNSKTEFILPDLTYSTDLATECGVPAGVPIFGSKAAVGGNELTIDDNGSALIGAQMIQIKPQASGSTTNAFAFSLKAATYGAALAQGTYTAVHPGSRKRLITTFNNTALGDGWNSEINYIFAMNAQGTSVAVTNLDTATLGNNVSKLY